MNMGRDRIHGGHGVTQAPAYSPQHYHNHRSCKAIKKMVAILESLIYPAISTNPSICLGLLDGNSRNALSHSKSLRGHIGQFKCPFSFSSQ